jgi:hypothetical protein
VAVVADPAVVAVAAFPVIEPTIAFVTVKSPRVPRPVIPE